MTIPRRREPGTAPRPPPGPATTEGGRHRSQDVTGAGGMGSDLTWGVGAVGVRLEVAASTLRTWERRYGVGPSYRTQGGHRRYTERDIDRVELMRRLVARGVSAQDAARVARSLDHGELDTALTEELGREPVQLAPADLVDAVLAAVVTRDTERLTELFTGLLRHGRLTDTWRDVIAPALVRMSCESSSGSLDRDAESDGIEVLIRALRALVVAERLPETGHTGVLFARNVPEVEAIPLLALEAALAQAGIATRAVGPETGTRSLGSLVTSLQPDVLVMWGHVPDAALRRALDPLDGTTFIVRALPAWPHEVSLRFGIDAPLVSTDVAGAVDYLLDRAG